MAHYRDITSDVVSPLQGTPQSRLLTHAIQSLASFMIQERPREVLIQTTGAPDVRLRLQRSSHEIKSIEIASTNEADIRHYVSSIHHRIATDGSKGIFPFTAFTSKPVSGQFVDSTCHIHLYPAPPGAPRPAFLMGDHPCTVCVSYVRFPNCQRLDYVSREREMKRWAMLTNAFTIGMKHSAPYGTHEYALIERDGKHQYEYVPLGYHMSYIVPQAIAPALDVDSIAVIPEDAYFSSTYPMESPWMRDDYSLPASLDELLLLFRGADDLIQKQFETACYWLYSSCYAPAGREDIRLICLAAAVEALFPKASSEKCLACDRPIGAGPTRLFKDFVDAYMPDVVARPQFASLVYDLRSSVVHGTRVLGDGVPWLSPFGGQCHADEQLIREFSRGIRMGFIRWLRSKAGDVSGSA